MRYKLIKPEYNKVFCVERTLGIGGFNNFYVERKKIYTFIPFHRFEIYLPWVKSENLV
mgnify:CR=1 FL=1